ncbi:zinc finger and BTB domain-containing protein 18.3 [Onthophagus taurus]|uniref:zinc finger and BTB domain-containing protein 18.3 n=1 Tax=Onthophagus taurus TaxID=166361 RepID=UPI000C20753D|nr:histone-lysine N-methyltransferase PRDM9 [Onthophagus taurus]
MDPTTENYQLKWHSFGTHLYTCIANHYNSDSFADVILLTIDGHQILSHRLVLSTCSQYFHQVLKLHYKISTTLPLMIVLPPEISYKTMKILIQYMYTGETTVSKNVLENVLRGGDLLKIQGLWRPRDESADKRLVKVHQKVDEQLKKSPGKEKIQEVRQQEVIKRADKVIVSEQINEKPTEVNGKREKGKEISVIQTKPGTATIKSTMNDENKSVSDISETEKDKMQVLVIKEEPLDWNEECEMELVEEEDVYNSEITIKPEIVLEDNEDQSETSKPATTDDEELYSPLMCELCSETFTIPAEWVKHIQGHTDMMPAKRKRRGSPSNDDDSGTFPPLHCDMCQKYFPTPAEWVHHIQNTHTEFELRLSNKTLPLKQVKVPKQVGSTLKICTLCNKKFPSHASMIIHKRTHTGERPYMCEYCCKGFNVKSNLLRHLRTLHDRIVNSNDVETNVVDQEAGSSEGGVKSEGESS